MWQYWQKSYQTHGLLPTADLCRWGSRRPCTPQTQQSKSPSSSSFNVSPLAIVPSTRCACPHVGPAQPPTPGHAHGPARAPPPTHGPLRHAGAHTHSRAKPPPRARTKNAGARTQRAWDMHGRHPPHTSTTGQQGHGQHTVDAGNLAPEAPISHPRVTRNHRRRAISANHWPPSDSP